MDPRDVYIALNKKTCHQNIGREFLVFYSPCKRSLSSFCHQRSIWTGIVWSRTLFRFVRRNHAKNLVFFLLITLLPSFYLLLILLHRFCSFLIRDLKKLANSMITRQRKSFLKPRFRREKRDAKKPRSFFKNHLVLI